MLNCICHNRCISSFIQLEEPWAATSATLSSISSSYCSSCLDSADSALSYSWIFFYKLLFFMARVVNDFLSSVSQSRLEDISSSSSLFFAVSGICWICVDCVFSGFNLFVGWFRTKFLSAVFSKAELRPS